MPAGARLVGVFGHLAEWKAQHVAIEAVAALPGVHLAIAGEALFGEHAYRQRLSDLIAARGLQGHVHLLGFRDDVPTLMRACDAVVHCSNCPEPFGRVIVEELLAGRLVIATDGVGAWQIVSDPRVRRLVPPGDPNALAAAIARIFAEPVAAAEMAAAGHATPGPRSIRSS